MAEEVPPRDSPRLIEFDDGVHDLVRQDQAHVHPESRPEAEPLWAAGPNVGNRAGTVDDGVLRRVGEEVEDTLRDSGDDPLHRNDRRHALV
jgi:hypothetical protein